MHVSDKTLKKKKNNATKWLIISIPDFFLLCLRNCKIIFTFFISSFDSYLIIFIVNVENFFFSFFFVDLIICIVLLTVIFISTSDASPSIITVSFCLRWYYPDVHIIIIFKMRLISRFVFSRDFERIFSFPFCLLKKFSFFVLFFEKKEFWACRKFGSNSLSQLKNIFRPWSTVSIKYIILLLYIFYIFICVTWKSKWLGRHRKTKI